MSKLTCAVCHRDDCRGYDCAGFPIVPPPAPRQEAEPAGRCLACGSSDKKRSWTNCQDSWHHAAPAGLPTPYTREELNGLDERIAQHNDALWLRRLLATARQGVEDGERLDKLDAMRMETRVTSGVVDGWVLASPARQKTATPFTLRSQIDAARTTGGDR